MRDQKGACALDRRREAGSHKTDRSGGALHRSHGRRPRRSVWRLSLSLVPAGARRRRRPPPISCPERGRLTLLPSAASARHACAAPSSCAGERAGSGRAVGRLVAVLGRWPPREGANGWRGVERPAEASAAGIRPTAAGKKTRPRPGGVGPKRAVSEQREQRLRRPRRERRTGWGREVFLRVGCEAFLPAHGSAPLPLILAASATRETP